MTVVFGEDAGLYDRARPEYPSVVAEAVLEYAGRPPSRAAEVGAGTGKGTALFAGRGFPITCVEPDVRMSELLVRRFPGAEVVTAAFEDWVPPVGGVDLLYAAMAWHWVEAGRRVGLAARALADGGTLALIGRMTRQADEALADEIQAVFERHGPAVVERPRLPAYAVPELTASDEFTEVSLREWAADAVLTTDEYLERTRTMSPFRLRPADIQRRLLAGLRERIDANGGVVRTRLTTYLVLARRTATRKTAA